MPRLEKAVKAAEGKVKLVKINTQEHNGVASQLGVRSIPAVYAFKDGQPVDGFMGAQPDTALKEFIDRISQAHSRLMTRMRRRELVSPGFILTAAMRKALYNFFKTHLNPS